MIGDPILNWMITSRADDLPPYMRCVWPVSWQSEGYSLDPRHNSYQSDIFVRSNVFDDAAGTYLPEDSNDFPGNTNGNQAGEISWTPLDTLKWCIFQLIQYVISLCKHIIN